MSGLHNSSNNRTASNLPDNSGRSFATSFSAQSGAPSPAFHPTTGSMQGLHNFHGNFNVANMPGTLGTRSLTMNIVPASGVQQPSGNFSSGRFASNNIAIPPSQISHGSSHGHSGVTNRGGMSVVGSLGYNSSASGVGGAVPGMAVSQISGNAGHLITDSVGNMVGGGSIGRSISSGAGLSMPDLTSRLNLTNYSELGNVNVQGSNRLMGGVFEQASSAVSSMFGNSYHGTGPLSQNHVQSVNNLSSMRFSNDVNANDGAPFDLNDFPQLNSRPSSAGGPQGQGSRRKQGLGANPIVQQQNQEFSIQNEDFPALPGSKGRNADNAMDSHQKVHDNAVSMMQPQHFSVGRSAGFNLSGSFSYYRPQQQQQQHPPSVSGSGLPFSSHASYHPQTSRPPPGLGSRPLNSANTVSGIGSYDQPIQQQQNPSQFRLQQISGASQSYRDQGMQPTQDSFGMFGLLDVMRMHKMNGSSLALGTDLSALGLHLTSAENLHTTFASPWSNEPLKGDSEFTLPQCYYNTQQPPALTQRDFSKFQLDTLFYTFYSMPKDVAQLYAANELHKRGWRYHREQQLWFTRVGNVEPLVKTNTQERGSYTFFDPNTWKMYQKDNFVVQYEMLEQIPALPQQH